MKQQTQQTNHDEVKKRSIAMAKAYSNSIEAASISANDIITAHGGIKVDPMTLHNEIKNRVDNIRNGETNCLETTLSAQTVTLNLLFNKMIAHATSVKDYDAMQMCMEMALKAQNACRKTVLAISALKNPQNATFVKQQNVAFNQQVNNDVVSTGVQLKSQKIKSENELIGEVHHEKVEFGATNKPSSGNQTSETMATVNRSQDK